MLVTRKVRSKAKSLPQGRGLYIPNALRLPTEGAEIYVLRSFLNRFECRTLVARIRCNLRPSTLTPARVTKFRTSKTADLGLLRDPIVDEVENRICKLMGLSRYCAEPIQGQLYRRGQEFKTHTDYFKPNEFAQLSGRLGQRTYTFLVFLNEPSRGGMTSFRDLGIFIRPRTGMALIWNNLTSEGKPNPLTRHQGKPVLRGSKAILTKWFRTNRTRTIFRKEPNEYIPPLTPIGFKKARMPNRLFEELKAWYVENHQYARPERVDGAFLKSASRAGWASDLVKLANPLKQQVKRELQPIVERWLRRPVTPTFVYGIRIYRSGAMLMPHRDRWGTHVIGVILAIDQKIRKDWDLEIEDHYYRSHRIVLHPGEMLLYEGARLMHSRIKPLRGSSYANLFCHFVPKQA